jgi:kynureninase
MILIRPRDEDSSIITTSHIISTIDKHASSTALILLPGIQYYTGQYLDIYTITAHAHLHGIIIGWDLAHAVGNIDVQLHDWDVDFAVWCNYKYINSGPGAIAGLFVHSNHGAVGSDSADDGPRGIGPRLCGWWGSDKSTRFQMSNSGFVLLFSSNLRSQSINKPVCFAQHLHANHRKDFKPIRGAAGFQLGNPSALAVTALLASLEIFSLTSMSVIRAKSVALTAYLEALLLQPESIGGKSNQTLPFQIITPSNPSERGAQLSVRLKPGLLEGVLEVLKEDGVVVDDRKPDVIRVAPAPLYNTYSDVWEFARLFRNACHKVEANRQPMLRKQTENPIEDSPKLIPPPHGK